MEEKQLEISNKIAEIQNLTHVLKVALLNSEQPTADTLPYGNFLEEIEHKINSLNAALEELFRT